MPLSVGCALTSKKQASFLRPSLMEAAAACGVELRAVDFAIPLSSQGPFDVIMHKMPPNSPHAADWTARLEAYVHAYPSVVLLDPPAHIMRLGNRMTMLEALQGMSITDPTGSVSAPRQLLASGEGAALSAAVRDAHLPFPLVAKPLRGELHTMALVHDEAGLDALDSVHGLTPPFVLQEFINHGGVLFKVFVIGDAVVVQRRRSLPDQAPPLQTPQPRSIAPADATHAPERAAREPPAAGPTPSGLEVISAISRLNPWYDPEDHHGDTTGGAHPPHEAAAGETSGHAVSEGGGSHHGHGATGDAVHMHAWEDWPPAPDPGAVEEPPEALMAALGRAMRARLGLQLFNLDVIRAAEPGPGGAPHFLVIDINYFPGYAKLPGYEALFATFLQQQGQGTRVGAGAGAGAKVGVNGEPREMRLGAVGDIVAQS